MSWTPPPSSSSRPTPTETHHHAFVIDNGLYSIFTPPDQLPEASREHEILEIAKGYPENVRRGQYPEVNDGRNNNELMVVGIAEEEEQRDHDPKVVTPKDRILGVRAWVLVVLVVCVVVAVAVAVAVGLAIGIPASRRKYDNIVFTTRLSPTNALAVSGTSITNSQSSIVIESRSAKAAATTTATTPSTSSESILPKPTSLSSSPSSSSSPSPSTSTPTLTPKTITCPTNDTSIYTTFSSSQTNSALSIPDQIDSHNLKYRIHCKRDYPVRGDVRDMFAIIVTNGLTECIQRCSMFNLQLPVPNQSFGWLCSGVALVEKTCTLKNSVTGNATSVPRQDMVGSAVLVWE